MNVASAIEIYTTVFGWILYDRIWQTLLDTGIVYFMMFGIFLRISVVGFLRQGAVQGASASIREAEIAVIGIFTVALLAGAPFINLKVGDLGTAQACGAPATTGGNTGTTFDQSYAAIGGQTGAVPIWWYGILAIASGITDATIAAVPCTPDFRVIDYKVDNTRIADPNLRRQLQLFANNCWRPALAQFNANQATLPVGYAPDDINWPGAQFFVDSNGYYGNANLNLAIRASEEIPGFPYDANRDTEYQAGFIPTWGRPECKDWWSNGTVGLRARILGQFKGSTLTLGKTWLESAAGGNFSQTAAENLLIRKVFEGDRVALTSNPAAGSVGSAIAAAVGNLGLHKDMATYSVELYVVKQAAPIVQSYVLMGIYLLLPLMIVFSGFSIETVFTVTLAIFALKFCSALWAIATWLDDNMMSALGIRWYDHVLENDATSVALGVSTLCGMALFIGMPALWLVVLGWIGFKQLSNVGNVSTQMVDKSGKAAASGISLATSGAALAVREFSKK